jgi:hypothetical protein
MSKIQLPSVFISPNMKLSQFDTEHGKGLNDAVLARKEKYITPDGKKGTAIVFSRVQPHELKLLDAKKRIGRTSIVRNFIDEKLKSLKAPQATIDRIYSMINRIDSGNIKNSDNNCFSADAFTDNLNNGKFFSFPEAKQVRFVDSANSIINQPDKK